MEKADKSCRKAKNAERHTAEQQDKASKLENVRFLLVSSVSMRKQAIRNHLHVPIPETGYLVGNHHLFSHST